MFQPQPSVLHHQQPPRSPVAVFDGAIRKLVESAAFRGIDQNFLGRALHHGHIPIRWYGMWDTVISDGDTYCDDFMVLIHGEMLVVKNGVELARIEKMGAAIGVIGFVKRVPRTAQVMAASPAAVLIIRRDFVEREMPAEMRSAIYRNIAEAACDIILETNATVNHPGWKCSDKLDRIHSRVLDQL